MRILLILALFSVNCLASTWSIADYIFATIAVDIAYINETTAISAVTDPLGVAQILWTVDDGAQWGPVYQFDGFRMYSGCAAQNSPNQSAVVADIFGFQFTDTQAFEFDGAWTPGGFKSQTVDVFGNGYAGDGVSYASVGMRWDDASNGVMVSHDQGKSFEFFNISVLRTWARYGAFPSDNVWYVTAGHWPNDNAPPLTNIGEGEYEFGSALSWKPHPETKQLYPEIMRPSSVHASANDETPNYEEMERNVEGVIPPPGWNGQIVKTIDGGKTWTSQYYNASYFYFNQITCVSETHCVTVAESQTKPGKGKPKVAGIHIFQTLDGQTWNEVFFQQAEWMSIFSVSFVSDTEVWACGADLGITPIIGFFWKSVDGGSTWKHVDNLKGVYPIQLSFLDPQHAWAVGPNEVQQSSLMKYA